MKTYNYLETPKHAILSALGNKSFTAELCQTDAKLLASVVNQGIDSHLEAVTTSNFSWESGKLVCTISPLDLTVIMRRLAKSDNDDMLDLRSVILQSLDIEEI